MREVMREFDDFVVRMRGDFPQFKIREGKKFCFRPPRTIIFERLDGGGDETEEMYKKMVLQLLHELGHGLLGHKDFRLDLERLKMERAAWEKARELCETYHILYDEEFVEDELDTYRDWVHMRATCPKCHSTRFQAAGGDYVCPFCAEYDIIGENNS